MLEVIKTEHYVGLSTQTSFLCLFSPTPTTRWRSVTPTINQVSFGCSWGLSTLAGLVSPERYITILVLFFFLNVCCPLSTSTDVTQKNTPPVTYSGFSHHPAAVLKAVHCVRITPLTCWFWLDLGHCWHTVLSAYSTFVLHVHRNSNFMGSHQCETETKAWIISCGH